MKKNLLILLSTWGLILVYPIFLCFFMATLNGLDGSSIIDYAGFARAALYISLVPLIIHAVLIRALTGRYDFFNTSCLKPKDKVIGSLSLFLYGIAGIAAFMFYVIVFAKNKLIKTA